jgi:hypothetical protein
VNLAWNIKEIGPNARFTRGFLLGMLQEGPMNLWTEASEALFKIGEDKELVLPTLLGKLSEPD